MHHIETQIPHRNWPFTRWIGKKVLQLFNWRIDGQLPDIPKAVIAVAPHTSNWDTIIALAAALSLDLEAHWLAKQSLFDGPLEKLLRKVGAVPVDRSNPQGIIDLAAGICRERPKFLLGLSPEGTRKRVSPWKSGCCRIAFATQVPLIPIALDYSSKKIRIFQHWIPDADIEANMIRLSGCFSSSMAKIPENFEPHGVRQKDE